MKRCKRIDVGVFHRAVMLYVDREQWARAVVASGLDYTLEGARADATGKGICTYDAESAKTCHVGVFDRNVGTLAHEMTHAAHAILSAVDVPFNSENNEALAYLVGYLVGEGEAFARGKRK